MELLREVDPNADVYLMNQQSWPFEYAVAGVAVREDFAEDEDADGKDYGEALAPNDVFILEGAQLRYGSEAAWRTRQR
jgi:hypothetical protein